MSEKLGITHSLPVDSQIIHSALNGKKSFGRISDLILEWLIRELNTIDEIIPNVRVLVQALLEFSYPGLTPAMGQIEVGISGHLIVLATRFEYIGAVNKESLERDLTQYWLNRDEVKLFKRVLLPHDRVEVRYQAAFNLIEWRVYRSTRSGEIVDNNPSFSVFYDSSEEISSGAARFTDFGDLPVHDWFEDIYRNRPESGRTGNMTLEDGNSQEDVEWARVVVEREQADIEQDITIFSNRENNILSNYRQIEANEDNPEQLEHLKGQHGDQEILDLLAEQIDLKDSVKCLVFDMKQNQLKSNQEINRLLKINQHCDALLRKKELINQRNQTELKIINGKLESERLKKKTDKSDHFRDKALEMFEMLKRVKEENAALEKIMIEEKSKAKEEVDRVNESSVQKLSDDVNKKLERLSKLLETEKTKVKSLSERVTIAEKESQAASPVMQDLESRIEHTLKISQQHKKETEVVKQKLVQAEAEKNKVKNELMKAQSQIQTLMKRQAA